LNATSSAIQRRSIFSHRRTVESSVGNVVVDCSVTTIGRLIWNDL
jgi:hypothetical protein